MFLLLLTLSCEIERREDVISEGNALVAEIMACDPYSYDRAKMRTNVKCGEKVYRHNGVKVCHL